MHKFVSFTLDDEHDAYAIRFQSNINALFV